MKELGGALFLYRSFLDESIVLSLSNLLEDTWIDLKREVGARYDIWLPSISAEFESDARMIRCLANVLKHNQGVIESSKSKHAAYLVKELGAPDDIDIATLARLKGFDFKDLIYRCYVYCLDLVTQAAGLPRGLLDHPEPERKKETLNFLVPPVLGLANEGDS
jgi:hypothetical protein